jgi:hypothetical protein
VPGERSERRALRAEALRLECAFCCRRAASTRLAVSGIVPKVDSADGAKKYLGQSAQRPAGSPARRIHVPANRRRAACRD